MKLRRLLLLIGNQKGFTLIEVAVVIAIAGIIGAGVSGAIFQVFSGNIRTSSHMSVVREVQNAGYWVSRDAQMAQDTTVPAAPGFPFILSWTTWDSTLYTITYSIDSNNELQRTEQINSGTPKTMVVAKYVDPAKTSLISTSQKLILTINATIGTGSRAESETRVYEILPRPQV